jgi:hypothetical protein
MNSEIADYTTTILEPVSSRCAPGSGEILVEHALELLNDLINK